MVSSNNLNAMSVSIIANDMSKTIFKSTYEDNISEYCKQVLDYEVESLELSRTRRDIGIYPSDLHSYEIISMAKDPAKFEMIIEGRSFPVEVNTFLVGQLEMAIKLAKPSQVPN